MYGTLKINGSKLWLPAFLLVFQAVKVKAHQVDSLGLSAKPYFFTKMLKAGDSLFRKDASLLKAHMVFDSLDVEMLSPSLLKFIYNDYARGKIEPTYGSLIEALEWFKTTLGYIEFRKSVTIYRKLEKVKVDPKNWEADKELFERLGFTQADLEDFKSFLAEPKYSGMNYREAYVAYMAYINSL